MRALIIMLVICVGIACILKVQHEKTFAEQRKFPANELKPEAVVDHQLSSVSQSDEILEIPVSSSRTPEPVVKADPFFKATIKPFMNQYCSDCHSNKKQKGKLNLEPIQSFEANLESVELWQEMYDQLEEGDMPPEDETQPSAAEKEKVMSWIALQIDSKREEMKNAAFTHLRRLNKFEYNRTVSDLLKIDTSLKSLSRNFPADDLKENLTNNGEALQVSAFHMEAYIAAAEEAIDMAVHFDKKPKVQSYTYLPPYKKSGNVLKAARAIGKNKFIDLVEQRSYVFHTDQESGVSESGYYKVTAKVQARNRKHELDPKGFPIPQDQLLRASIVLSNPASGDANYSTSSDRTVEEFELPDEKEITISGKYWIEKGYTAKIGFPTSVPRFKSAKGKGIDWKKHPKFFKNVKGAYAKFLSSQKFMQNHGPVIRVFDVKIEGPFYNEWPIASHKNLFGDQSLSEINVDSAIDSFAAKAFRRPIKAEDTVLNKSS